MAFAPRQQNAAKTAQTRVKLASSRLNASNAAVRNQEPSIDQKAPAKAHINASTSVKASQSVSTNARSVKPSASTRRVPNSSAIAQKAAVNANPKARSASATSGTKAQASTASKPAISAPLPRKHDVVPSATADPLQIAAQLYPWTYMTSTLESTFKAAEISARGALDKRAKELSEDEAEISDQRVRFDAERRIELFDELAGSPLSSELPRIMQVFLKNGEDADRLVVGALEIDVRIESEIQYQSPLRLHNELLFDLENVLEELIQLQLSVNNLIQSENLADNSPIRSVLAACLPLLQTRRGNLDSAQDLFRTSKNNLITRLHIESLQART